MKKFLISFLFSIILTVSSMAQVDESDDLIGPPSGGAPEPGSVPVDGGLSLLLAAGAAYGGRRLYRKREKG